jgi:hypothetical protein
MKRPDVLAYICNPSIGRQKQEDRELRVAWTIYKDPVSKINNNNNIKTKHFLERPENSSAKKMQFFDFYFTVFII